MRLVWTFNIVLKIVILQPTSIRIEPRNRHLKSISLRWPQLVRWIQHSYENRFIDRITYQLEANPIVTDIPGIKAKALDQVLHTLQLIVADS